MARAHTFVLVHGACHGGWCWRRVADPLRAAGHVVHTPTQTGVGERAHLLDERIGLESFIADLLAVLDAEELSEVVLVAHSLGAIPVLGVVDRARERIRRLVLLDGALAQSGAIAFDGFASDVVARRRQDAIKRNGVAVTAPAAPSAYGVSATDDAAWLERRLTPQPLRTYEEPLRLNHPLGNDVPCTYVSCTNPWYEGIGPSRDLARTLQHWDRRELATGHDAMITAPDEVIALLLEVSDGR